MKKILGILVILAFLIACEKNKEVSPEVPEGVINKTLEIFNGSVVEQKSELEDGVDAWEIKVENENGSIVKIYWSKIGQDLIKIVGQTAPYDYNISPGENLINLNTAMTIAISAVKHDNVNRWKLEKDDDFLEKWIYSFEFDEISRTVLIDALNGDILEID